VIALAALVMLTGALHEDGLADIADGFWGAWDAQKRLEIMKDSHVGAYGVIALVLSLLARWAALWLLFEAGGGTALAAVIAAAGLSRATMPALIWALPNARPSGLSQSMGRVEGRVAMIAAGLAGLAALLLLGWSAFGAVFWAAAATLGMGALARSRIGGQTGDVLGATQQIVEIAVLFSILA
jgi:adenosylcobinamide-GDP ribazoletransferase